MYGNQNLHTDTLVFAVEIRGWGRYVLGLLVSGFQEAGHL